MKRKVKCSTKQKKRCSRQLDIKNGDKQRRKEVIDILLESAFKRKLRSPPPSELARPPSRFNFNPNLDISVQAFNWGWGRLPILFQDVLILHCWHFHNSEYFEGMFSNKTKQKQMFKDFHFHSIQSVKTVTDPRDLLTRRI